MKLAYSTQQTDEERAYELVLAMAFRRGFAIACLVIAVLCVGELLYFLFATPRDFWSSYTTAMVLHTVGYGAALVVLAGLFAMRGRFQGFRQLNSAATVLVLAVGALLMVPRLLLHKHLVNHGLWCIADLALLHLAVCLILPWKPWESIQPFLPLLVFWAVVVLLPTTQLDPISKAVVIIIGPASLLPGAAIAWWRTRRLEEVFTRKMLGQKVQTMGGELSRARIVHDAMFPQPFDLGHVAFQYEYLPIQEIGGDYVHVHHSKTTGCITVTLLDVAGHGLAAALTVNRLFGELERIRAENPDAEPAEVMELLNRYIYLTMAHHSLFATGACMMLDPSTGVLKWVNAGHPPAFVRRGDGSVTELHGTAMLLGVESFDEFDGGQEHLTLAPGDVLIAYTDGAIEARDTSGRQFGIKALRDATEFDPPPRNWSRFLAGAVAKHHSGNCDDDILIVSLALRGLHVTAAPRRPETEAVGQPSS